jgi:hypothetical protein
MFVKLLCDLLLVLGGLLASKLYTFYLFPLTGHEPGYVFGIAIGSLIWATGVTTYLCGPKYNHALILLTVGYIIGLFLVGWMLEREHKEYCRTGGMPELFEKRRPHRKDQKHETRR